MNKLCTNKHSHRYYSGKKPGSSTWWVVCAAHFNKNKFKKITDDTGYLSNNPHSNWNLKGFRNIVSKISGPKENAAISSFKHQLQTTKRGYHSSNKHKNRAPDSLKKIKKSDIEGLF
jgi:predicted glycosyltransferase involved in capsule biosynthesis